ncbi:MAG TPA: hypothetical protein VFF49_11330 [Thermodesulfobacteriota bacterium]|nr:hypothetical protein [Thermodesulfobacteriota bacterium]
MATAQQLVQQGFYGYQGWDDASAAADFAATGGAGKGGPTKQTSQAGQPALQQPYAPPQNTSTATTSGQPSSAADLISRGYYGYAGWNDREAVADFQATGGQGKGGPTASAGAGAGAGVGITNQPTIDLVGIYKGLYESSGISGKEQELADKTKGFNEAVSKINDNPFLSEANRVGRIQKLQTDYNNAIQGVQNELATKKADVETQLSLQTKQFDINSQQAQQALQQFQTLLGAGALDSASGTDIANITRATGLSSSMIQSAIDTSKKSKIQTQVVSFDDGVNSGFAVINPQTGEIINKQVLAVSQPKASTGTAGERKEADQQQTTQNLIGDIQRGATLRAVVGHYGVAGGLSVEDIYRIYNTYSPYGSAGEDIEDVKEGKFKA